MAAYTRQPGSASADPLARAVRYLNEAAYDDAIACLRPVLAAEPDQPVALTLTGVALRETGDLAGAERQLRRALVASPGQPQVFLHLARTIRLAGRPGEAAGLYRTVLAHAPDDCETLAEFGAASLAAGIPGDAVEAYRRVLRLDPGSLDGRLQLATALEGVGRAEEAERLLAEMVGHAAPGAAAGVAEAHLRLANLLKRRRAFEPALVHYDLAARAGDPMQAELGRASALQHLHRFDEAADVLREAVRRAPLDMGAHLQLNELLYRQGDDAGLLASYDQAARSVPGSALPLVAKGRMLLKLGQPDEAVGAFEAALGRAPGDAGARVGLARALDLLGQADAARVAYDAAAAAAKGDPGVLTDAASFRLRMGDPARARDMVTNVLAADPHNQAALALLTLCHRALADPREAALADYDTLVRVFDLAPPPGFADMATFNRALAAYLATLHGDRRQHLTQTLRGGTRVHDAIFDNGHPLADLLRPVIDRAVARYIAELPAAADPALVGRRATGFRYASSWSSQFSDRGLHVSHMHPEGWISSAYYVAVPDRSRDATAREGWLAFGAPPEEFGPAFPPRRLVRPKPGRLVLFPSYFWHGTTPISTGQGRMTIAFDVAPAGAALR